MASVKTCFKCHEEKAVEEFYRHSKMADGRLGKCKSCTKEDVQSNRKSKAEYYKQYDRDRGYHSNPETAALWRSKYPDRRAAHVLVGNALRDGRLVAQPCFVCGERAQAHHPDYSNPLDVTWLCPTHHKEVHNAVS